MSWNDFGMATPLRKRGLLGGLTTADILGDSDNFPGCREGRGGLRLFGVVRIGEICRLPVTGLVAVSNLGAFCTGSAIFWLELQVIDAFSGISA